MKKITKLFIFVGLLFAVCYTLHPFFGKEEIHAENEAPSFTLSTVTGETIDFENVKGAVILNFWGTYCPPCKREMPALEAVYPTLQNKGIELLAINVEEPTRVVNQYVEQLDVSFPILLDRDGEVNKSYEVLTLPTTVFIKSGEIVHVVKGELTEEQLLQFTKTMN